MLGNMPKTFSQEAIDHIVELRRVEHLAQPRIRRQLADVRSFLERLAGRTVRPADAAKLMGISQPALKRWIDKGEIAAVMTPEGRREIPLTELVELLDEIAQARAQGADRPLTRVIRERKQRAAREIDVDRLLPRRRQRGHRTAELQSLAYHRLIAERLNADIVEEARMRLDKWRKEGQVDPRWAAEWQRVLDRPLPTIRRAISADSEKARALRQTSPFAGLLTEQERRHLTSAVEERSKA